MPLSSVPATVVPLTTIALQGVCCGGARAIAFPFAQTGRRCDRSCRRSRCANHQIVSPTARPTAPHKPVSRIAVRTAERAAQTDRPHDRPHGANRPGRIAQTGQSQDGVRRVESQEDPTCIRCHTDAIRKVIMKFLSPDSGFMRGLSDAVDVIWINILMLVTSIPIITPSVARCPAKARRRAIISRRSVRILRNRPAIG